MTQHDPLVTLRQIIDFCEAALQVLGDRDSAEVAADLVVSLALTRAPELIGEAANRPPPEVCARHPEVPWREMISLHHVLAHGYDAIDYDVAVDTVRRDVPPLIAQLRRVLEAESGA